MKPLIAHQRRMDGSQVFPPIADPPAQDSAQNLMHKADSFDADIAAWQETLVPMENAVTTTQPRARSPISAVPTPEVTPSPSPITHHGISDALHRIMSSLHWHRHGNDKDTVLVLHLPGGSPSSSRSNTPTPFSSNVDLQGLPVSLSGT